ncbi:ABC transporter permease [Bacteroidales bacterium]|nr:ABC transporter permease [Bacteroidales bacterium]
MYTLRSFFRHLTKNKAYTLITIGGFALSMTFVIILSIYLKHEKSVDQFHEKKDRIFMLTTERSNFAPPVGQRVKDDYPEVEAFTRMYYQEMILDDGKEVKVPCQTLLADSTFFDIFSYKLIQGNKGEVLRNMHCMVLSESFAKKLFPNESAIGKSFEMGARGTFTITGIMADIPFNSHIKKVDALIQFDALIDLWHADKSLLTSYGNSSFYLYFLTKPNTDFASKMPELLEDFKKDYWIFRDGRAKQLFLTPLTEIYLNAPQRSYFKTNNSNFLKTITIVVFLILALSVLNYVNLTIAQSHERIKSVGIRRLVGISKYRLFSQYISESLLLCVASFFIAIILSQIALPIFNNLLNSQLLLSHAINLKFICGAVLLIMGISLLSGLAPTLIILSKKPVNVVKGERFQTGSFSYRNVLIGFQFIIAIGMLICTSIIVKQMRYIEDYAPGYDKSNMLNIVNGIAFKDRQVFREELLKLPGVNDVCYTTGSPFNAGNNNSFKYKGDPVSFQIFWVDSNFFEMFGIDYKLTGTAYSDDVIWINEKATEVCDLGELPGTFNMYGNEDIPVYGIIKNLHFRSLHEKIEPLYIRLMSSGRYPWDIHVKLNEGNEQHTISQIKEIYHSFTNGSPLEYMFADHEVGAWYEKEARQRKLISYFTALAILIALTGMIAIVRYYIKQNMKQIGIRKVNGAKVSEILGLLNKDFIAWVIGALFIACPISFIAMNAWLATFVYHTTISWWVFGAVGLSTIALSVITVSWQSWWAANRNPVEALRYE